MLFRGFFAVQYMIISDKTLVPRAERVMTRAFASRQPIGKKLQVCDIP